ncbi:S1C family serine protease [Aquipuribacter sp. MA13-6]|uniref:S1C family serine protease n=1 Tax=unclassified Aquipuribacter TaxID=2635084 RepID=UPI003EEB6394
MTETPSRPQPQPASSLPVEARTQGTGRPSPGSAVPPRPRRRLPLVATAVGATLVMAAAGIAGGAVVVSNADDVLAALRAAPAVATGTGQQTDQGTAGQDDEQGGTDAAPAAAVDGVDWGAVASRVQPGVVAIQVASADGSGGEGSGVVIDAEGHVLTNNHVVATAASGGQVRVTLSDGRVLAAEIVGLDPSTDLAVLRLVDAPDDLTVAELGRSEDVQVGDPVMAIGNPLGLSGTVTTGIVSALDRPVTTQSVGVASGEPVVTAAVQTDAAVNPGNSGGPLVDARGQVIGINSSIAGLGTGSTAGSIGLGFAIPVDAAAAVAEQLIEDGTAEHARLGVYLEDTTASVTDGEWAGERLGAGLADVEPGSAADTAGLRPGDVVVAVDGRAATGAESLTALVRVMQPGDTATLVVERDGQAVEVPVTVEAAEV